MPAAGCCTGSSTSGPMTGQTPPPTLWMPTINLSQPRRSWTKPLRWGSGGHRPAARAGSSRTQGCEALLPRPASSLCACQGWQDPHPSPLGTQLLHAATRLRQSPAGAAASQASASLATVGPCCSHASLQGSARPSIPTQGPRPFQARGRISSCSHPLPLPQRSPQT